MRLAAGIEVVAVGHDAHLASYDISSAFGMLTNAPSGGYATLTGRAASIWELISDFDFLNQLRPAARNSLAGFGEMIDKLRNLVRNSGDPDAYLDRWCAVPLIAIDEIDKYDTTEFAEKSIFRLFNARYQRLATAGTLLAYNLDRESRLPPFLRSRINDGRFHHVRLGGGDVRPALDPWDRGETEDQEESV